MRKRTPRRLRERWLEFAPTQAIGAPVIVFAAARQSENLFRMNVYSGVLAGLHQLLTGRLGEAAVAGAQQVGKSGMKLPRTLRLYWKSRLFRTDR